MAGAPRTRVLLVRHADVENPRRLLYGHLDGFQLSALGRAQALAVGDRLSSAGLKRIVHSPLARAHETAELINSRLATPAILEADPELREAEFSRYLQGLPYWQIPVRRPLWFVHKAKRGLLPGDEAVDQLGGRGLAGMGGVARGPPRRRGGRPARRPCSGRDAAARSRTRRRDDGHREPRRPTSGCVDPSRRP